ncbi:PP2C family protein-serine/threonine phosphatase [Streptomyces sp. NPDC002187]|uniref:PP2C family protein-serine/threonine phosphatase n=1 Tax=Streptomyces sp. NPDC002187 TaxID=3364637 RepID=UPI00367B4255
MDGVQREQEDLDSAVGQALATRLRAMERASQLIGTTLDERTTCEQLVGFLHPDLCDAAAVDLLGEEAVAVDAFSPAALTRAATAGRRELLEALFAEDARPRSPGSAGSGSVRAPHRRGPVTSTSVVAGQHLLGAVSVPLLTGDRVYGVLVVVRAGSGFSDHEAAVVRHAAQLASVHIGHARRHATVRRTALRLQRALLAEPGRPHPNLEIATRYLPSGSSSIVVGGDWFETVRLHFGRTLLVMGDVMGHGLDAAVDMNAYRTALRYVASTDLQPHRVLRQLDTTVSEEAERRPATCLLVRVDPAREVAAFASAGHLPPAIFSADGTAEILDVPVGPPLGTGLGGYELSTRTVTPDETLLLFTDGLVERRDEDIDVSLARLAGLRVPPGAGAEQILGEVLTHLDVRHAEDDVAVLAARIRRRPDPQASGPDASGSQASGPVV